MFALPVCARHHPYVSLAERGAARTSHARTGDTHGDTHTASVQALEVGMGGFYSCFFWCIQRFSLFPNAAGGTSHTKKPKTLQSL